MDFTDPEDHRAIRRAVRELCAKFDDDYWMRHDLDHEFPWEFYTQMARGGWIGIAIPEEYGGGGQGITEASIVLEEVCASGACMNGASAVHLSIFGMHPVVLHGSEDLKRRHLPRVADGELHIAFGITEPDAGLDTTSISTRAVRRRDALHDVGTMPQGVDRPRRVESDKVLLLTRTTLGKERSVRPTDGMTLFLADPGTLAV